MKKRIFIISTSLRQRSNSEAMANAFAQGAQASGHEVEQISLRDYPNLAFCKGCLTCQKTRRCVIHDDGDVIAQKMGKADVLVFATPIYYYEMSGQMKTLLDRANPLFPSDYAFRDIYLLAAAAEDGPSTIDGALQGLQGWIACFEKARLKGTVFGGGVTNPGEIAGHSALEEARKKGQAV